MRPRFLILMVTGITFAMKSTCWALDRLRAKNIILIIILMSFLLEPCSSGLDQVPAPSLSIFAAYVEYIMECLNGIALKTPRADIQPYEVPDGLLHRYGKKGIACYS